MATFIKILIPVVILAVVILIVIAGYIKAPTDQALIISGLRKKPKVIIGTSSIRIPLLQRVDRLSLKMISVDVKTSKTIPTLDYINVMVDSVATVKVGKSEELLSNAAQNFLNRDSEYINNMIVAVLEGNLREIIGSMKLVEIMNDRKSFATKVQENAATDMANMGLEIVSFNIQNIDDAGLNVIDNLGIANTVEIKKSAEISRANAEKEIAVAQAEALKLSNDAKVASETAIAEKNNELAIRKAQLRVEADTRQAEADAAYDIQKQEQQKTIEITTANAQIARQEKEIELKEKEAAVQEQALNAQVRKQAEAEKYRITQLADAELYRRTKEAEAARIEAENEAKAKIAEGEAQARVIEIAGNAEAAAIAAKGKAEAEAMEKKAEALRKYGQAAMLQMIVEKLPEMAGAIAEPLSTIDKVTIIDGGAAGSTGVDSMGSYVPGVLAKTIEAVKETTGFDLKEVMAAETIHAKTDRNISVTGLDGADITVNNPQV